MTKNELSLFEEKFVENLDSICLFRIDQSRVKESTRAYKELEIQIQNFYNDLDTFLLMLPHKQVERFFKKYLERLSHKTTSHLKIVAIEELCCFEIALNILKLNKLKIIRARKEQLQIN